MTIRASAETVVDLAHFVLCGIGDDDEHVGLQTALTERRNN
jgi:hypothetical protein